MNSDCGKIKKMDKKKKNRIIQILDRLTGYALATFVVIGIIGVGVVFVCTKGPSDALKSTFVRTFLETRRFGFIPHLFLTDEEVEQYDAYDTGYYSGAGVEFDAEMVNVDESNVNENGEDAYGLVDDDGDGIIYVEGRYKSSTYYMIVVLDPKRVFVGMPDSYGGYGLVLEDMVKKYDAIGGINAGSFLDYSGAGTGGDPAGITIIDHEFYNTDCIGSVAGLTDDGVLFCGYYDYWSCVNFNFKYAVSFNPTLIVNGNIVGEDALEGGVNPRTCIGQRADGAIVMFVVDGRQAYSIGLSQKDCAELLLSYGVINAINMDGGSSTCMYHDGEMTNHPSNAAGGSRYLPTAWLYK